MYTCVERYIYIYIYAQTRIEHRHTYCMCIILQHLHTCARTHASIFRESNQIIHHHHHHHPLISLISCHIISYRIILYYGGWCVEALAPICVHSAVSEISSPGVVAWRVAPPGTVNPRTENLGFGGFDSKRVLNVRMASLARLSPSYPSSLTRVV